MEAVDCFVVMINCQFNREHFQHRFNYKDHWYTMGVRDVRHPDSIRNRIYANPHEDWEKIKRRLPQYEPWLKQFDDCVQPRLWQCNYNIILRIAAMLGIKTKIIIDPMTPSTGTNRLVEICSILCAKTYLSGRSGIDYLETEKFANAGIKIEYQTVTDTRHVFET